MTDTKANLQAKVQRRIVVTLIFGTSIAYIAWVYYPFDAPKDPTLVNRLVFTLRWLVLSMLPIIFGVKLVADVRFHNMDTAGVMTTTQYAEQLVRLKQRALQNTLEQTALHVPIMLIFSTYVDSNHLKLVPIVICMFNLGRIIFFIGYLATGDQFNRAFGFVLTFFSNVIPVVYCLYRLFVSGASYGI
ncbi:transmembrane protein 79-like [Patiria miniata]|uniref:MAPEG family protein n=1 Tax=Patiria miniata TaxID=46514 RepID=A0A914B844_PATMI|nr:transmembrane protein 79-like [Patiria miniata]